MRKCGLELTIADSEGEPLECSLLKGHRGSHATIVEAYMDSDQKAIDNEKYVYYKITWKKEMEE